MQIIGSLNYTSWCQENIRTGRRFARDGTTGVGATYISLYILTQTKMQSIALPNRIALVISDIWKYSSFSVCEHHILHTSIFYPVSYTRSECPSVAGRVGSSLTACINAGSAVTYRRSCEFCRGLRGSNHVLIVIIIEQTEVTKIETTRLTLRFSRCHAAQERLRLLASSLSPPLWRHLLSSNHFIIIRFGLGRCKPQRLVIMIC